MSFGQWKGCFRFSEAFSYHPKWNDNQVWLPTWLAPAADEKAQSSDPDARGRSLCRFLVLGPA